MARTDKVILLTGDYAQRLDEIYSAANEALKDESPRTLAEGDPYADLQADYAALKAEAIEEATASKRIVEMTAVMRPKWRELKQKYPPRTEGHESLIEGDRLAGVNTEEVEDDLVHASLTSPEFASRSAFDEWADTLSEGEWQMLVIKAWELANGARFDPKSLPASRTPSTA